MHNQFKTQKFKHLMLTMGPRDLNSAPYSPVHCSSHSMTSFQSSELTELPVVENSQLFAKRAHSACTAHGTPPVLVRCPYLCTVKLCSVWNCGCVLAKMLCVCVCVRRVHLHVVFAGMCGHKITGPSACTHLCSVLWNLKQIGIMHAVSASGCDHLFYPSHCQCCVMQPHCLCVAQMHGSQEQAVLQLQAAPIKNVDSADAELPAVSSQIWTQP